MLSSQDPNRPPAQSSSSLGKKRCRNTLDNSFEESKSEEEYSLSQKNSSKRPKSSRLSEKQNRKI